MLFQLNMHASRKLATLENEVFNVVIVNHLLVRFFIKISILIKNLFQFLCTETCRASNIRQESLKLGDRNLPIVINISSTDRLLDEPREKSLAVAVVTDKDANKSDAVSQYIPHT